MLHRAGGPILRRVEPLACTERLWVGSGSGMCPKGLVLSRVRVRWLRQLERWVSTCFCFIRRYASGESTSSSRSMCSSSDRLSAIAARCAVSHARPSMCPTQRCLTGLPRASSQTSGDDPCHYAHERRGTRRVAWWSGGCGTGGGGGGNRCEPGGGEDSAWGCSSGGDVR